MKPFLLTVIYLSICLKLAKAQNHVQNPGFEQMDTCGAWNLAHNGVVDALANHCVGWNSATGSPDLFATCGVPGDSDIPTNFSGHQATHGGTKYCGAVGISAGQDYHECFGNQLLTPLQTGAVYEVSYYVSRAEASNLSMNNLSAVFTTSPYSELINPYARPNFSHIRDTTIVTNETGWTRISGTFTADSAYTFMILGNTYDLAHTQISPNPGNPPLGGCYYYFDDVCVVPLGGDCSLPVAVSQPHQQETLTAYPNPIVKHENSLIRLSKESSIEVYDLMGQSMGYYENVLEVDASGWPAGVYLLRESGGGAVTKIIIIE